MRDVITITEYMSMRGRYKANVKRVGQRDFEVECGRGVGAAAAKATELAMLSTDGKAIIVANKDVMQLIPKECGGKA